MCFLKCVFPVISPFKKISYVKHNSLAALKRIKRDFKLALAQLKETEWRNKTNRYDLR